MLEPLAQTLSETFEQYDDEVVQKHDMRIRIHIYIYIINYNYIYLGI